MSKTKQLHFYGKILKSRPADMAGMVARRLREAVSQTPQGVGVCKFGDVSFAVDLSMHAITRKYYFQTHEMFLENHFQQHLTRGRTFIDIGANLGYWSAFATSLVGPEGQVHAFEPVPRFFELVNRLALDNPRYKIFANNVACGDAPARLPMQVVEPTPENYNNLNTNIGSSSVLPGFLDHEKGLVKTVDVDVIRFDDYVAAKGLDLDRIGLIKLDVEGYESLCLDGMSSVLNKPGRKIPILCEILTDLKRPEPLDGRKVVARLQSHGYTCFDATTLKPIDLENMNFEENLICV